MAYERRIGHKKWTARKCVFCGEEIKNPNINYCMKCGNVLWTKSLIEKKFF